MKFFNQKYFKVIPIFFMLMSFSASANESLKSIECRSKDQLNAKAYILDFSSNEEGWTLNDKPLAQEQVGADPMGNKSYVVEVKLEARKSLVFIVNRQSPMESEMLVRKPVYHDTCWDGCDNSIESWESVQKEKAFCSVILKAL